MHDKKKSTTCSAFITLDENARNQQTGLSAHT
jgi:hypothetical protein